MGNSFMPGGICSRIHNDNSDFRKGCFLSLFLAPWGGPQWVFFPPPTTDPGPYTITVTSLTEGCTIEIDNVLFGDVYLCSGQSNMHHLLQNVSLICLSACKYDMCLQTGMIRDAFIQNRALRAMCSTIT